MKTKNELAAELRVALELRTRGTGSAYYALRENSPEWMTEVVRGCHAGGEMPNDWRYEFITGAAEQLIIAEDWEDLECPEPDIYNRDLLRWLSEAPGAVDYCDTAAEEYEIPREYGLMGRISQGQAYARNETLQTLAQRLTELAEGREA